MDPIYIIRDAAFGRDFTPKVITAFIAIALVLWDWRTQKRKDYLWVFLVGTVLWGGAEAFLAIQGIRDMPERVVAGRPIGLPLSYLIQGMSEGAFIAVIGLFVGDRYLCRARRRSGIIIGAVALVLLAAATFRSRRLLDPEAVASRRDILDTRALVVLLIACGLGVVFYVLWRQWRPRTMAMFVYMVIFGAVWAATQVAIGGRWVEVDAADGGYERAGPLITLFALSWDVIIEIALAYVLFLALPVWLRLMRDTTPLPTCDATTTTPGDRADPVV